MTPEDKLDQIIADTAIAKNDDTSSEPELNPEALASLQTEAEKVKSYEDRGIEAAALGAARGLTFGLSDQFLAKAGKLTGYTRDELKDLKKYNELESTLGEAAGVIAPSILAPGAGAIGSVARGATTGVRAADAAGKMAQKAFAKVLAEQGKKSVARDIVAKTIPKLIGSGVEGAAYGAGQLVSEDALGTADFNGQNLIASVGTGALLGGAARGIFEAPKLLAPIAKKAGNPISKKASEFFDRPGAALELIGATPKKAQKLANHRPEFVKDLPDWLASKANLKPFQKTSSLNASIEKVKNIAAEELGNVSRQIDDILIKNADTVPPASMQYLDIATAARSVENSKLIKGLGLSKIKQVKKAALKLADANAESGAPASAFELRQFKREIDDIIPYGSETSKMEVAELKKLRTVIDQKVKDLAKTADELAGEGLLSKYESANKDYSYASTILPNLDSKLAKEVASSFPGFRDSVLGGVTVGALGGPAAAVAIGTKKLLESDLRRRMIILSSIEKTNREVEKKLNSGIKTFFGKAVKTAPALTASLSESSYALSKENKKPANRKEAFQNTKERISSLIANPEEVGRVVTRRTLHLQPVAPNSTNYATQVALSGLQFLNQKLPKQASANTSANQFAKRPYEPSELEMSKFERYLQAVENPLSALDQLQSGTLTREAAEAIQFVYPQLFNKMQEKVIDELQKSEKPVPYNKRLQLGILLNVETDMSLNSSSIASLQENLLPQEPQAPGGPTAARADKLNLAERQETKQNRIAQK